jgi:hypothetical protein
MFHNRHAEPIKLGYLFADGRNSQPVTRFGVD